MRKRTEMSRCDESVASLVPRTAADEDALVLPFLLDPILVGARCRAERVQRCECLRDRQAGEFHQLRR